MSQQNFSKAQADAVYQTIFARRDMRHFKKNSQSLPKEQLNRFLQAAHAAPSVGFMQPWRFIRITDNSVRQALQNMVEQERLQTAKAMDKDQAEFLKIKVEGIADCSDLLVVCLTNAREPYIFGRRTMPYMDLASASCAIQNLWLAARAENIGMGWVSIFEPKDLARLLHLPTGAQAIAILCLGEVEAFYDRPMLEQENWDSRRDLDSLIMENRWQVT